MIQINNEYSKYVLCVYSMEKLSPSLLPENFQATLHFKATCITKRQFENNIKIK